MVGQYQPAPLLLRQLASHKIQIQVFVAAIDFLPDDRVTVVREMNADLMLTPRARHDAQQGKSAFGPLQPAFHPEFRLRRRAIRTYAILDCDAAPFVPAQWCVDHVLAGHNMSMYNGQILLPDFARFPNPSEFARDFILFRDEHQAARFAVEAVDQMRPDPVTEVKSNTTDQAGITIRLGRVAHEARRFVDHQQFRVFVNDLDQLIHARKTRRASRLSPQDLRVSSGAVKEKANLWLPIALMVVFALTRWPGVLPPNFSAAYALAF